MQRRETRQGVWQMMMCNVQWEKFYFILKSMSKWYTFSSVFPGYIGFGKDHIPEDNATKNVKCWSGHRTCDTRTHEQEKNISGPEPVMLTVAGAGACATMNLCHACRAELLQVFFEGKSKIFYGKYDVLKTSCVWITFFIHSLPDFKKIWKNSWLFPSLV